MLPDIDAVTAIVEQVGRDVILPRFRNLSAVDIHQKQTHQDPDDVVTVVDRDAEIHLSRALVSLVPGSLVIGEEAVHADPGVLRHLDGDGPLWILDPIDGTKNFVAGLDGFGTMLGFVVNGEARCGWVHLPARRQTYVAEKGGGAWFNGARMMAPTGPGPTPLHGRLYTRYLPQPQMASAERVALRQYEVGVEPRSSAVEYTDILCGRRDFGVYYRLLPWDHAAPSLILTEGGGVVEHLDGSTYRPRSADQTTIVASSREIAARVRSWFTETAT